MNALDNELGGTLGAQAKGLTEVNRGASDALRAQKSGKPWRCGKLGGLTTMEACQTRHAKKTRPCGECSIPSTQPSKFPAWEDFQEVIKAVPKGLLVHANDKNRLSISASLVEATGWKRGQAVDVKATKDGMKLGLKLAETYTRYSNYLLAKNSKGITLGIACTRIIESLGLSGAYKAEVTPWGVVVDISRNAEVAKKERRAA